MRSRARFMLVLAVVLVTVATMAWADEAHCTPAASAPTAQETTSPPAPDLSWDAGPADDPCRDCTLPGCPPVTCLTTTVPEPSLPHFASPARHFRLWQGEAIIVPSRRHQPPTPPPNVPSPSA